MFGRRGTAGPAPQKPKPFGGDASSAPKPGTSAGDKSPAAAESKPAPAPAPAAKGETKQPKPNKAKAPAAEGNKDAKPVSAETMEKLSEVKVKVFNDLMEAVDLSELSALTPEQVREEINDMVSEIISMRGLVLSIQEHHMIIKENCTSTVIHSPVQVLWSRDA